MISGTTRVLGVIGDPVEHSASPAMHNAAINDLGLDYAYVAFKVEHAELSRAVEGLRAFNMAGINVTVPHKKAVIPYLDEVSPEAKVIGAVNTIVNSSGKLIGYNTDVYGFTKSINTEGGFEKWPTNVVLLGAGGAARAVLYSLLQRSEIERVHLINRTMEKAELLANELDYSGRVLTNLMSEGDWDQVGLLINSTSVGLFPNVRSSPLQDTSVIRPDMLVVDNIYRPLHTELMSKAEECGAKVVNGLGMLIWQGVRSFELWTGITPSADVMVSAALENMKS